VPIAHPRGLCQVQHLKFAVVASRWQRVGDLIRSKFAPNTFRGRSKRYSTSAIWPVTVLNITKASSQ